MEIEKKLSEKLQYCVKDLCKKPDFSIVKGYIKTMTGGSYGLLCQLANIDPHKLYENLKFYPQPKDVDYDIFILCSPEFINETQKQINQMFFGTVLEKNPKPSRKNYIEYEDNNYNITVISRYHYNSTVNDFCTFNIIYINNIINVKNPMIKIDPKYYKEIIRNIWYDRLIYRYRIVANERNGEKLINDYIRVGIANIIKQTNQTIEYFKYANSINLPEFNKAKALLYNLTNKKLITHKFNNTSKSRIRRTMNRSKKIRKRILLFFRR